MAELGVGPDVPLASAYDVLGGNRLRLRRRRLSLCELCQRRSWITPRKGPSSGAVSVAHFNKDGEELQNVLAKMLHDFVTTLRTCSSGPAEGKSQGKGKIPHLGSV